MLGLTCCRLTGFRCQYWQPRITWEEPWLRNYLDQVGLSHIYGGLSWFLIDVERPSPSWAALFPGQGFLNRIEHEKVRWSNTSKHDCSYFSLPLKKKKIYFLFNYVCLCMGLCRCLRRPEAMDPFGAEVIADCVVFDVGAGHLPQVFCKSCVHTEPLSQLSSSSQSLTVVVLPQVLPWLAFNDGL